jgi:hypothetical protein
LLRRCRFEDIEAVVDMLILQARDGDAAAAKQLLERCLGKVARSDVAEQLDELEVLLQSIEERAQHGKYRGS